MSTSLTDIDHRVSVLEDLFKQEIRPKIESMDRAISQVSDRTEATREEVRAWNSSIHNDIRAFRDDVDRRFRDSEAGINARFDAVDGYFGIIDDEFKAVHNQFAKVNDQFAAVNQRFTRIDQQFAKIDQRFTRIDQQFAKIDQRFEKVDQQFAQVNDRFEKVDQRLDRMDTKLDEVLEAVRSGQPGK